MEKESNKVVKMDLVMVNNVKCKTAKLKMQKGHNAVIACGATFAF